MKFVLKKLVKSELRVLNEREIQERLYGSFRGGGGSNDGQSVETAESMPKLRFSPPRERHVWVTSFHPVMARIWKQVTSFSTSVSPRFAGIATALILFSVISFFAISNGFRSNRPTRQELTVRSGSEFLTSENSEAPTGTALKLASIAERPSLVSDREDLLSTDGTEKLSDRMSTVYAVQICTYQRESDAVRLTKQLEEMNFKPFYRRMISHQLRTPFYVVFLGHESTYADAQSLLKQFQKTELFRDFSDSFIRSL